jgi:hypothetical protein
MGNFIYPDGTPLGTVPANYVLPSEEWELTIQQIFKAPNFEDGSTHAPSAFVTVGGSGFQLTGTGHSLAAGARLNVESTGEIRVKNGALVKADGSVGDIRLEVLSNVATLTSQAASVVNLDGTTNVKGELTFKSTGPASLAFETTTSATWASGSTATHQSGSTTTFAGSVIVSATGTVLFQTGSSLTTQSSVTGTWNGAWTFGSTLAVTGATTLSSQLTCNASLSVATTSTLTGNVAAGAALSVAGATTLTGAAALSSTLAVAGVSTFSHRVVRSGANAYAELRIGAGPDSSTTVDAYEADVWNAPLTADRTWTLNNGPASKAFVAYFVAPASHTLTISATGFSADLSRTALSGDYKAIIALWTGTEWLNLGGPTV